MVGFVRDLFDDSDSLGLASQGISPLVWVDFDDCIDVVEVGGRLGPASRHSGGWGFLRVLGLGLVWRHATVGPCERRVNFSGTPGLRCTRAHNLRNDILSPGSGA